MSIQEDITNHDGIYKELTYEKIEAILKDVMFHPKEDFSSKPYRDDRVLVDAPEGWEDKRREELKKTIPPGSYEFNSPGCHLWTGQGGAIDLQIAMEKSIKGYK